MYVTKYVDNTQYGQSSAMGLASYLEKESLIHEQLNGTSSRQLSAYLDKQNDVVRVDGREYFFNSTGETYDSEDVTKAIDANIKGLKKSEALYYSFSISPSTPEIAHLRRTIADTQQALIDAGVVIPDDFKDAMIRNYLKDYATQCMDAYAQNFGHPKVKDNRDILWFGMVEKDRYWKKYDSEVRKNAKIDREIANLERQRNKGHVQDVDRRIASLRKQYIHEYQIRPGGSKDIVRAMMPKTGDNWHIHVTVSRRDITNSFNLSPNANGRGSKNHVLNGQQVRVGFNRETFKIKCEKTFDELFTHQRLLTESYEEAKKLRAQSGFAYEKQLLQDRTTRKTEDLEYNRLKVVGYNDYYAGLLQAERLDARQMMQLKGHLARQLHHVKPELKVEELMDYRIDELQEELVRIEIEQDLAVPNWKEGVAVNLGDRTIQTAGLRGYHPVHTAQKVLRRGIAINRAIDRRQEMFDKWFEIYSETWFRENYTFDSVASLLNTDCLLAQSEYLAERFGVSVILSNAQDYAAKTEQRLVTEFLKENLPAWREDITRQYAIEIFGQDGAQARTMDDFTKLAQERLLPEDARRCIGELAKQCDQPRDFNTLRLHFAEFLPEQTTKITADMERFIAERGQALREIREILSDQALTAHAKEEALLKLALENRTLDRELRNLRVGILRALEQQNPGLKDKEVHDILSNIFEELGKIVIDRQAEFATVIDGYIQEELPNYYLVVEKQSQLESLLREIIPDKEKYAERLLDVNNEMSRRLSPHAEELFEQHGQRLFGPEIHLHNEHDFLSHVEKNFSGDEVRRYKESLHEVYTKIDEKRRALIQDYVNTKIPGKELETVRRQQNYINRFINKQFPAQVAKSKKEELQRTVAASCHRTVIPAPEYKVLNQVAQKEISTQAMAKASQVQVMPVSPQQLVVKAAFKLVNILTKGY